MLFLRSPVATLALTLLLSTCAHAAPQDDILGKWKLTSPLDLADITSRDEKEARQLLGHVLSIRKEGAQLDNYQCALPDFETKRVETNLYVKEYAGITPKKLRLPNPVTVVDISCTQVFIKSPNRIVLFWDGWFFEAVRVKE